MRLFLSVDADKLVRAFEATPLKTREEIRQVVRSTARNIHARASNVHRYTSRSGLLEREGVAFRVDGMDAVVFLSEAVPYGRYLHEGTGSHVVEARNRRAPRFALGDGFVFARRVRVSGIKADPFLYNSADVEAPIFEGRLMAALDRVLGDL